MYGFHVRARARGDVASVGYCIDTHTHIPAWDTVSIREMHYTHTYTHTYIHAYIYKHIQTAEKERGGGYFSRPTKNVAANISAQRGVHGRGRAGCMG